MSAQSGCVLLGYLSSGILQWLFGSGRVSDIVSETLQQADLLDLGAGLHSKVGEVNFLGMSFNLLESVSQRDSIQDGDYGFSA